MKMSAQALQAQLNEAYAALHQTTLFTREEAESMSPPLLLQVSERWAKSERRLLIVGQETKGWAWTAEEIPGWKYPSISTFADFLAVPTACEALIDGHRLFEFSLSQPANYNGYTWKAYRQLRAAIGEPVDGFETGTLFSNLFRMDLGGEQAIGASPEQLAKMAEVSAKVLLAELAVLKPTDVIFFTGPNYERWLATMFGGVEVLPFKDYDPTRTARLHHPLLPDRTWRTYHPGFLNRGNWHVVNDLAEELARPLAANVPKPAT